MAVFRKVKYSLLYRFVQFLIFVSNALPRIFWLKTCGLLGSLAYVLMGEMRRATREHLTLAFGETLTEKEIKALSGKVFEMLGKNAGEMLRASRIETLAEIQKILVTEGIENLGKAVAKGKGIIFLSCHMGAFDLQISNMALLGYKPYVIGTPLKDERLNDLLWEFRKKHGAVPVVRGEGTFRLLKVLLSGGSMAILIDQDTKVKSRFVNFFGKAASTPIGATILAMKTGAPIVPSYVYLGADGKQHMVLLPEIPMRLTEDDEADLVYNTQIMTSCIEDIIRQHPDQWVWMHERWKTKPGEEMR